MYPSAPFFLAYQPAPMEAHLSPIFAYARSGMWPLAEATVLGQLETLVHAPDALVEVLKSLDVTEEDMAARQRLTELREALRSLRAQIENLVQSVAMGTGLSSIADRLTEMERQQRKTIIGGLVRRVVAVDKKKVPLAFNVLPALPAHEMCSCLNLTWPAFVVIARTFCWEVNVRKRPRFW
jgi:hypothetical protein